MVILTCTGDWHGIGHRVQSPLAVHSHQKVDLCILSKTVA